MANTDQARARRLINACPAISELWQTHARFICEILNLNLSGERERCACFILNIADNIE
jgi:hypothetical protein